MLFFTGEQLLNLTEEMNLSIAEIMLLREIELEETTEDFIKVNISLALSAMFNAIEKGLILDKKSLGGLIGGQAKTLMTGLAEGRFHYLDEKSLKVASYAMAVMEHNAVMGVIVAAPTAGSSGILPAVLKYAREEYEFDDETLMEGFLTAAAVGLLFTLNASVSGAEGGCQAEIGTATAMSAAALVAMKGGSPKDCLDAAGFVISNIMGLVCDPIAGLVEEPCMKRNALGALNALLCADFVLMGIGGLIPFDEVVKAMHTVGKQMPESLRETALGGIAATPTAKRIEKELFEIR